MRNAFDVIFCFPSIRLEWAGLLLILALTGCGSMGDSPPRRVVQGLAAYDSKPIAYGVIRFLPQPSGPLTTAVITDGYYVCNSKGGVPAGEVRVEITALPKTEGMTEEELLAKGVPPVVEIPAKYNKESTLKEKIPSGRAPLDLNFDLSK